MSRDVIFKDEHLLKRKAELLVQRLNNEDNKLTAIVEEYEQNKSDEESEDLYSSCEEESNKSKTATNGRKEIIKNEQLPVCKSNRESKRLNYLRDYNCNVIEKMCLIVETESSLSFKEIMTSEDADQ